MSVAHSFIQISRRGQVHIIFRRTGLRRLSLAYMRDSRVCCEYPSQKVDRPPYRQGATIYISNGAMGSSTHDPLVGSHYRCSNHSVDRLTFHPGRVTHVLYHYMTGASNELSSRTHHATNSHTFKSARRFRPLHVVCVHKIVVHNHASASPEAQPISRIFLHEATAPCPARNFFRFVVTLGNESSNLNTGAILRQIHHRFIPATSHSQQYRILFLALFHPPCTSRHEFLQCVVNLRECVFPS